jgi:foldase protein PrsA
MRSVKLLWGAIVFLLACILVLTILLSNGKQAQTNPPQPTVSPNQGGQKNPEQVVAIVGDTKIKYQDLISRLQDKYGAELLNLLIDREVIRQEADELQVKVTREEIDKELVRMQHGYESEEDFYKSMKEQLGLTKSELSEDVYYKLLLERLATRNIKISDAEVQKYIQEHPEEFKSFIRYHLLKAEVKTKEEANQFIVDWNNGHDFGVLAKERSTDTESAKQGGDIGWIEDTDPFLPPYIVQTARTLKVNELSKPIPSKNGFVILQLLEKKETNKTIDADTREFIRHELALQKAVPLKELLNGIRESHKATVLMSEFK